MNIEKPIRYLDNSKLDLFNYSVNNDNMIKNVDLESELLFTYQHNNLQEPSYDFSIPSDDWKTLFEQKIQGNPQRYMPKLTSKDLFTEYVPIPDRTAGKGFGNTNIGSQLMYNYPVSTHYQDDVREYENNRFYTPLYRNWNNPNINVLPFPRGGIITRNLAKHKVYNRWK